MPMTLISFCGVRPPTKVGVAMTFMCTTVSTPVVSMTLAIIGLRMSARTNSTSPMSCAGGMTSTPMTRATEGWALSRRASRPPRYRETPVTSTTEATPCSFTSGPTPPTLPRGHRR